MTPDAAIDISGEASRFRDDIGVLLALPDMPRAVRDFARRYVAHFEHRPLLNLVASDRGRVMMAWMALYFDALYDPAIAGSGLTVNRFKAACADTGLCSQGRASAMLGVMRFAKHVETVTEARRGHSLRLTPTDKLRAAFRERIANTLRSMSLVLPEGRLGLARLGDPVFEKAFIIGACQAYLGRERPMASCPLARMFADKKAGFLILFSLMLSTDDEGLPVDQPMTASIASLSKAFAVSRPQIKLLFRAAVEAGALRPSGDDGKRFYLSEAMRAECMLLMASFWVIAACGVRAGLAAVDDAQRPVHHAVL
ncbi:hypothetical protein [Rhizobium sp. TRM95796]|uniref:hypothetical protein n=1 Tax=Rhizobium sp. TRM95796 TaxID=2979862 RepID=UPI0021E7E5B9|nr:hypothetical protein [Rhizobium sp. TRM95796]MCV3764588.1 hypothetical protein [Rhizobium sp. TRM95796]